MVKYRVYSSNGTLKEECWLACNNTIRFWMDVKYKTDGKVLRSTFTNLDDLLSVKSYTLELGHTVLDYGHLET